MCLGDVKWHLPSFDHSYSFELICIFLLSLCLTFCWSGTSFLLSCNRYDTSSQITSHFIISSLLSIPADFHQSPPGSAVPLLPLQLLAASELNFWFMGFVYFPESAETPLAQEWLCAVVGDRALQTWTWWADCLQQRRVEMFPLFITPFMSFASWSENELEPNPAAVGEKIPACFGGFWKLALKPTAPQGIYGDQLWPQVILLTSGKYLEALLHPLGVHRDHASKVVWQQSHDSSKLSKIKGKAGVLFLNRNHSTESKWVSVSLQVDLMEILPNLACVLQWADFTRRECFISF